MNDSEANEFLGSLQGKTEPIKRTSLGYMIIKNGKTIFTTMQDQTTPTETFNTAQADAAQRKLCQQRVFPHFAPTGDCKCYRCKKDIYQQVDHGAYKTGHSVQKATTSLITGCPHCHYSFCD